MQITSDLVSNDNLLVAIDGDYTVYYRSFNYGSSWTRVPQTICSEYGGGNAKIDQIAAFDKGIYGIRDNGGAAGEVYVYYIDGSQCWEPIDNSHLMMSISANPTNTVNPLYGPLLATDNAGKLYFWCVNTGA